MNKRDVLNKSRQLMREVNKLEQVLIDNKKLHDTMWEKTSKAMLDNVDDEYYNYMMEAIQTSFQRSQEELINMQTTIGVGARALERQMEEEMEESK